MWQPGFVAIGRGALLEGPLEARPELLEQRQIAPGADVVLDGDHEEQGVGGAVVENLPRGTDGGWETAGFVRTNDLVPQRYMVLLIGVGETIVVERLALGGDQTAEWTVPLGTEQWSEAVLVVSGLAPLTTHPAPYQLTIAEQQSE